MSNIINQVKDMKKSQRGFTIVELLIVIVVIAILAAITIVAYNGIQNRAKASAAQELASQIYKKAEAWNAIQSSYPNYCQLATNTVAPTLTTAATAPTTGTSGCTNGGATGPAEAKIDDVTELRFSAATDQNAVQYKYCSGGGGTITWVGGGSTGTINAGNATGTCNAGLGGV
ncbi:Fimbrial protein [Candidatus Saccharibacteria bacterium RAAC3_TM7_1]|nr:Fimbrial protein [Candidatus Saccharibacteria bacterium RAAC3_TM7_1]HCZ28239.1 prepilin-type N-terminal cleavage/methylation domain-containing protein [Candidatus Saccharibacteria bacterium]